jgi:hypothetical protein
MISEIVVSPYAIRVIAALVNFGVATAGIIFIKIRSSDMRWSRTARRFVTRDPLPAVFWSKMIFAVFATLFAIALGVLLLTVPMATGH